MAEFSKMLFYVKSDKNTLQGLKLMLVLQGYKVTEKSENYTTIETFEDGTMQLKNTDPIQRIEENKPKGEFPPHSQSPGHEWYWEKGYTTIIDKNGIEHKQPIKNDTASMPHCNIKPDTLVTVPIENNVPFTLGDMKTELRKYWRELNSSLLRRNMRQNKRISNNVLRISNLTNSLKNIPASAIKIRWGVSLEEYLSYSEKQYAQISEKLQKQTPGIAFIEPLHKKIEMLSKELKKQIQQNKTQIGIVNKNITPVTPSIMQNESNEPMTHEDILRGEFHKKHYELEIRIATLEDTLKAMIPAHFNAIKHRLESNDKTTSLQTSHINSLKDDCRCLTNKLESFLEMRDFDDFDGTITDFLQDLDNRLCGAAAHLPKYAGAIMSADDKIKKILGDIETLQRQVNNIATHTAG